MKNILKYASRYWYLYIFSIAAMVISILLDVTAPKITQLIIDRVIIGGQLDLLMNLLFGLLGIGIGRAIFQYAKEFIFDATSIKIACNIRRNLFSHIQKLSMGYFDRHNTGELMARVKDDVDRVWNALGFVGMLIIECTIHTIIVVVCMYRISPMLTLVPICIMPVIAFCAVKMENRLGKVYDEISEETAELNTVAQENLAGVRTVKSFAREHYEIDKFKSHNKKYYSLNMKQAKTLVKFQPNISFMTKVLLILVVVVGGLLVINDRITMGQLGAFAEYANNIIWPMEMIGWLSNDFAAAMASNKKIEAILAEEPVIKNPELPVRLEQVKGDLEFRGVYFDLYDSEILKDVSFTLKKGQTIGIMGMTGSGKTSIVNLIERFYDVSKGEILLDGVNIRKLQLSTLRKSISVVMQDVFLFSDSINENIKIGQKDNISMESILQAADIAYASDFIDRLSSTYNTVIGERGVGLSGGQKQRISIARAIAKETPILILDDSTSALDMETEFGIQQQLQQMNEATKIIIAHRISAVRSADEIIILDNGRIVERGTHEQLMKHHGYYYRTYQVQYEEEVEVCL